MPLLYFAIFLYVLLVGVVLGSFVTALVHRHRHGWSMWERRSKCPQCKHPLSVKDLLPVASYWLLGGKCRYCHKPIGRQYMLTELAVAATLVVSMSYVLYRVINLPQFDWWWVLICLSFASLLVVLGSALAIYDIRWGELPNQWTLGGAAVALLMAGLADILGQPILWQPEVAGFTPSWWSSLLSGLVAAGLFVGIVYLSEAVLRRPGMGMGDAKLALLMGFVLGFPGIVVALYVAFVFGAVLSLLLVAGKRKNFEASLPFGPFMIWGLFASLWISSPVVAWYSTLWM